MLEDELIDFVRAIVGIRSFSDREGEIAHFILGRMEYLGYDEAFIDSAGSVVGRVGRGGRAILFDSHMDTVGVEDEDEWTHPPFGGEIADGRLYGRGAADMKSALGASLYAAAAAKRKGLTEDVSVYVTCTVCEEFCDGVSLELLMEETGVRPDYVVICEPSDNTITLGHKGKFQASVTTRGVSAHGSAPEKGVNAVYEMAKIIKKTEELNDHLSASGAEHGTIVLSGISSVSASLNAVPSECSIYLDRRLIPGETEGDAAAELDSLIEGHRASWEPGTLRRRSWKGRELTYTPSHEAWRISPDHELTGILREAYTDTFGSAPSRYDFWDFSTNAVTPVKLGIPTIGFGPGEYKLAHMRDENCELRKITGACRFYTSVIGKFAGA
ncbi:MAG: YgeY family selenium metabolism-linked hydrolase [Synergistaceae bacterium]|nr:YgeY family selenium metabolism-linked hydrolase [Synergistaceae bacterium]